MLLNEMCVASEVLWGMDQSLVLFGVVLNPLWILSCQWAWLLSDILEKLQTSDYSGCNVWILNSFMYYLTVFPYLFIHSLKHLGFILYAGFRDVIARRQQAVEIPLGIVDGLTSSLSHWWLLRVQNPLILQLHDPSPSKYSGLQMSFYPLISWHSSSCFFLLYSWCSFILVAGITVANSVLSEEWKLKPFSISFWLPTPQFLLTLMVKDVHTNSWYENGIGKQNKIIISLYFPICQQILRDTGQNLLPPSQ